MVTASFPACAIQPIVALRTNQGATDVIKVGNLIFTSTTTMLSGVLDEQSIY